MMPHQRERLLSYLDKLQYQLGVLENSRELLIRDIKETEEKIEDLRKRGH